MDPDSIQRLRVAAALLAVVLAAPAARAQDQATDVAVREREALAACDSNQAQKGIDLLARLWADTMEPTYVYDQGRCYQKASMPKEARARFQEFLRVVKDPHDELAVRAQQFVKELDAELAARARESEASKSGPAASVPAALPRAPNPEAHDGSQHVDLLATGSMPATTEERPIYRRAWFWAVAGAVVAGGVVAAVLLTRGGTAASACPECSLGTAKVPTQ
jgi:hypothetical protein